ncbi:hypothetical protein PENSPDRAFT_685517 [Peniophora sp. CONT]|nr:hypothetical protein PENSPDRAFT_685517 [Peniophora sp. CONT]
MDMHTVADDLLELLASDKCNETNVLLGTLATFLETNASSAFEAARAAQVTNGSSPSPSESKVIREAIATHRRETASLEKIIADLRLDNRHLAKRGKDLGDELVATKEKLARIEEMYARSEDELIRTHASLIYTRRELKRKRER